MEAVRAIVLLAATVSMGLVAGAFVLYAHSIMPGLGRTDDRTFVGAFQAIDRAIINPLFMISSFMGALVFTAAAGLLHLGEDERAVLPWIVVAFVLYLVSFAMTVGINVPLNNTIKAAGDPDNIDVEAARRSFNERRWNTANVIRAILSTFAVGFLAWALVEYGQTIA